jgi:hypothetical protein
MISRVEGVHRVSTKVSQEVGVLLEYEYIHSHPSKQKACHHTGWPASCDAAASVDDFVHATNAKR